jgi:hypothetical protein
MKKPIPPWRGLSKRQKMFICAAFIEDARAHVIARERVRIAHVESHRAHCEKIVAFVRDHQRGNGYLPITETYRLLEAMHQTIQGLDEDRAGAEAQIRALRTESLVATLAELLSTREPAASETT